MLTTYITLLMSFIQLVSMPPKEMALRVFANRHISYMSSTGVWSHDRTDCNYRCRIDESGMIVFGKYRILENLYRGRCDVNNAFKRWRESPTHKAVLDTPAEVVVITQSKVQDNLCYITLHKMALPDAKPTP